MPHDHDCYHPDAGGDLNTGCVFIVIGLFIVGLIGYGVFLGGSKIVASARNGLHYGVWTADAKAARLEAHGGQDAKLKEAGLVLDGPTIRSEPVPDRNPRKIATISVTLTSDSPDSHSVVLKMKTEYISIYSIHQENTTRFACVGNTASYPNGDFPQQNFFTIPPKSSITLEFHLCDNDGQVYSVLKARAEVEQVDGKVLLS